MDLSDGSWMNLRKGNWSKQLAHIEHKGKVISVGKDGIYILDPQNGSYIDCKQGNWPDTYDMVKI